MIPTVPPRRERPNSRSVSLTALKSRVSRIFLLARIKQFNSWGKVKTRWKYLSGKSSAVCFCSHWALAKDWHLGQWRLRQELYVGCSKPQVSHCLRCPPNSLVRQTETARITFR